MSLVGTRPPTVDEWDKYELHHRARLATKPGLTGMWQVSGRSNITDFEEVVKLDKQYIRRALRMTSKEVIQLSNQCRKTAVEQFDYRQWIEPVQNFLNRNVYTEKVKMVEDKT